MASSSSTITRTRVETRTTRVTSTSTIACSKEFGTRISDEAGARALAACRTFTGDIAFPTPSAETLEHIQNLTGLVGLLGNLELSVGNTHITRLEAPILSWISGSFIVNYLGSLAFVPDLDNLQSVSSLEVTGHVELEGGIEPPPGLSRLTNLTELRIEDSSMEVVENYELSTLDEVRIVNCPDLAEVHIGVSEMNTLVIESNGNATVSFPQLISANNMTIGDCSNVQIPLLREVDGSLRIHRNAMSSFASRLSSVSENVVFNSNWKLYDLSLPDLRIVGGDLIFSNNTNLTLLESFHQLERVNGTIDISGPVTSLVFPRLETIAGNLFINSTSDMSCEPFNALFRADRVGLGYHCNTTSDFATSAMLSKDDEGGVDDSALGPSGDDSIARDAGLGVGIPSLIVLLAALVFFIWWRPHRRKKQQRQGHSSPTLEKEGEEAGNVVMLDSNGQRHEMEQLPNEMPLGSEAQELPAQHGYSEIGRSFSMKSSTVVEGRHEMPANEAVDGRSGNDGER